jgi:hypothetical protein
MRLDQLVVDEVENVTTSKDTDLALLDSSTTALALAADNVRRELNEPLSLRIFSPPSVRCSATSATRSPSVC